MSPSPSYPEKKEGEGPLDDGAAACRSGVLGDSNYMHILCFKREREYIRYNYNYLIQPNKLCSHSEHWPVRRVFSAACSHRLLYQASRWILIKGITRPANSSDDEQCIAHAHPYQTSTHMPPL